MKEDDEAGAKLPTPFCAVTRQEYGAPFASPVTVVYSVVTVPYDVQVDAESALHSTR